MLRLDQQTLNDKATNLSSDQLVAFGTLLLAAFTAASILVAVVLDSARVQCASIPEYTKRYAEIMNMFPPEGRKARLDGFLGHSHVPQKGTTRFVLEKIVGKPGRLRNGGGDWANGSGEILAIGPQNTGFSQTERNREKSHDWLAVDAVRCEVFSGPNSLLTGKNAGNSASLVRAIR
jgi:hypothetical protein